MKHIKTILIAASLCCAASIASIAQEQPQQEHQEFFGTVTSWFSSFNTNYDGVLESHRGTLWVGQDWQSGAHSASSLGLEYIVYKQFSLVSETRFEDVTGKVKNQQFGVGYNVNVHDVRLTGYVSSVVDMTQEDVGALIGLRAEKLLTEHTFISTGISVPLQRTGSRPTLTIGTGFVF